MCFDLDSGPPIAPIAGAAIDGRRVTLQAADGTDFAAFHAQPSAPTGAAMLILPDVRGLYPFYEELALRFAEAGVEALTIDYFGRTAGTALRGEDFDFMDHVARTEWRTLLEDMRAGRLYLGGRPGVRAVFDVGFCYGGRLAFDSGTQADLDLAGVIGFYGVPVGEGRGGVPAPVDVGLKMTCPVLGLFGGSDPSISAADIDQFRTTLEAADVENTLVSYDDAPHSFFDRKAAEFAEASSDAWQRVLEFIAAHTPAA